MMEYASPTPPRTSTSFDMTELPHHNPSLHRPPLSQRYIVSDVDGTLTTAKENDTSCSMSITSGIVVLPEEEDMERHLKGMASASLLPMNGGRNVTVITGALSPDHPTVLSISVNDYPVEVDLSECSEFAYHNVISTRTFIETIDNDDDDDEQHDKMEEDNSNSSIALRVNMVDVKCNVLTFHFLLTNNSNNNSNNNNNNQTLIIPTKKTNPVSFHPLLTYMNNHQNQPHNPDVFMLLTPHPGASLNSCALLTWISPTKVLFALAPLLLVGDLVGKTVIPWVNARGEVSTTYKSSYTARISGLVGYATNPLKRVVFGSDEDAAEDGEDAGAGHEDHACTTSALCFVKGDGEGNGDGNSDALVFTLHADGVLRKWILRADFDMHAMTMVKLKTPDQHSLPDAGLWSPSHDALALSGRLYRNQETFALIVSVRTSLPVTSGVNDGDGAVSSVCTLKLFHGEVASSRRGSTMETIHALSMGVPGNAEGIVSLGFVPHAKCELYALYYQLVTNTTTTHGAAMSPSQLMRVCYTDKPNSTITDKIIKRAVIARYPPSHLAFITTKPQIAIKDTLDNYGDANRMDLLLDVGESQDMDHSDAAGVDGIKQLDARYLRYLFQSTTLNSHVVSPPFSTTVIRQALDACCPPRAQTNKEQSIEQEVLTTMNNWARYHDIQKASSSNAPTTATHNNAVSTSIYHAFAAVQQNTTTTTTNTTKTQLISQHNARWNKLLLAVWEIKNVWVSPKGVLEGGGGC